MTQGLQLRSASYAPVNVITCITKPSVLKATPMARVKDCQGDLSLWSVIAI